MNNDYSPTLITHNEDEIPTLWVAVHPHESSRFPQQTVYAQGVHPFLKAPEIKIPQPVQDEKMSSNSSVGKVEFRITVGLAALTVVAAVIGTTWTVSNAISEKNTALRQELSQSILVSKQEITQRVDRVEDKIDSGFKDTSSQLTDLKILLATKNKDDKS